MPIAFTTPPGGLYRLGIAQGYHYTRKRSEWILCESDIFCPLFIYSREGIPDGQPGQMAERLGY